MSVNIELHGLDEIKEPYRGWVYQRNLCAGNHIAKHVTVAEAGEADCSNILVASRTMTKTELGLLAYSLFYGLAVDDLAHVDKPVLHLPVAQFKANPPHFYNQVCTFAEKAREEKLVLPGRVVFSPDDLMEGFMNKSNRHTVRSKLPGQSDGNGQSRLANKSDAERLISALSEDYFDAGVVLEPNLLSPKTISVGFTQIGKSTFSFVAYQKDEVINTDQGMRTRYLGADIILVRGQMNGFLQLSGLDQYSKLAVKTSVGFWERYSRVINPIANRLGLDYVFGHEERPDGKPGEFMGGITDITARPGGTDPAIFEGISYLRTHPNAKAVRAQVRLDYSQNPVRDGAPYVYDPGVLEIYAKVTGEIS